jgi:hypothetical protein
VESPQQGTPGLRPPYGNWNSDRAQSQGTSGSFVREEYTETVSEIDQFDTADKNEPEALAEFVRREKDRLAPQAHGKEN